MEMTLRHQNFMLAVRREMGWPLFKPANDCIGFSSGQEMDFAVGTEIARIGQLLHKDVIYTGWASIKATQPTSFAIAYRELLTTDIVDRLVPYAANDQAPLILVSTRADEFFSIDRRGSLVRVPGKPKAIAKGRKLAMQRIKAAAAAMEDELMENNRFVPPGADWVEPEAETGIVVRFG